KWQRIKSQCCQNDTDGCPFHSFNGLDTCSLFVETSSLAAWNGGINPYNMYASCVNQPGTTPQPGTTVSTRFRLEYKQRTGKELDTSQLSTVPCMNETAVTTYLNRPDVRRALGIPTSLGPWAICSGDIDMACNFLMGQRFSRKLGLKEIAAKKHYIVDGQIAGFHTHYDGLHFVTVRGAGHMVPTDKPSVAYHIINSFLFDQSF
ncbi:serine carboxypeptidase, partial [Ostertagia ostertagi]